MSADAFGAFEEVELSNRSALREVRRRYVSFLTLLARYEGSVICIIRGLFSCFVGFAIPCWPAAGRVTHMTYFKIFAGALHPHMHCWKVTVLRDSKRHAPVRVIWRKRELLDFKWNSYCLRPKMRIWGESTRALPKSRVEDKYHWKKKRTSGYGEFRWR